MKLIVLTLALIVLSPPAARADFEAGEAAARKGDYGTAYKEFMTLAVESNIRAQHNIAVIYEQGLGSMYEQGKGVAKDYGQALKWYRASA